MGHRLERENAQSVGAVVSGQYGPSIRKRECPECWCSVVRTVWAIDEKEMMLTVLVSSLSSFLRVFGILIRRCVRVA